MNGTAKDGSKTIRGSMASNGYGQVAATTTAVALFAAVIAGRSSALDAAFPALAVYAFGAVLASLIVIAVAATQGFWSTGFWFALLLSLFHLGLAIPYGLGIALDTHDGAYVASWFGPASYRNEAVYLSVVALSSFTLAYVLVRRRNTHPSHPAQTSAEETRAQQRATQSGAALILAGTVIALGNVAIVNPSLLLGGSRAAYWNTAGQDVIMNSAAFAISLGAVALATGAPSKLRRLGFWTLSIFGIWALSTGARGMIMYALLAVLVVMARRGRIVRASTAIFVIIAGLVTVAFIGEVRQSGPANAQITASTFNPVSAVTEMGTSIRPVIENLNYARALNEPPSLGATYTGVVVRAWERALGLPRPDGALDLRLAGTELISRIEVYQIGYSAVAEAYRNWRTTGVALVFSIFGATLSALDHRTKRTVRAAIFTGTVFFALIFHIRQPSIQIVPLLLAGAGLNWWISGWHWPRHPHREQKNAVGAKAEL